MAVVEEVGISQSGIVLGTTAIEALTATTGASLIAADYAIGRVEVSGSMKFQW